MGFDASKVAKLLPAPLGQLASIIPFSWRLGRQYAASRADIREFATLDPEAKKGQTFHRFRSIVEYAYYNNSFYGALYRRSGLDLDRLRRFEDVERVPIVTKADLQACELEVRSTPQPGRIAINTGGTSGQPLAFYVDRHAAAREWAHMHTIWDEVGYKPTHLRLTFRGLNLGQDVLRYSAANNEFFANTYKDVSSVAGAVMNLARRRRIAFIHGYPSAIYQFSSFCASQAPELVALLRRSLRGVMLGSEYPAPQYRAVIESTFGVPTISWYGHSEMAVLAYEASQEYVYEPMHTYGLCEASSSGSTVRLVGTSFYNTASPFIRYDTGDSITPEIERGLLARFQIAEGRVGDFILDRTGQRISLTALVFGRHHAIFSKARFIQVQQEAPGRARILVTTDPRMAVDAIDWSKEFDCSGVDIAFQFVAVEHPVRSPAGKVLLRV